MTRPLDWILAVTRRVLPPRLKRYLKRFWDPNQSLSGPDTLLLHRAHRGPTPRAGSPPAAQSFDVVCFSAFDWRFRHQRPQQLMAELGRRGHRVFYLSPLRGARRRLLEIEEVASNVWEVALAHPSVIDRYAAPWPDADVTELVDGLRRLRLEHDVACAVAVVQVPTWADVAIRASDRFAWPLVYDCMDDWTAFAGVASDVAGAERRLAGAASAITVSSDALARKWSRYNVTLLRNAADFDHFSTGRSESLLPKLRRPVIGYYGAIAEWFDTSLLADVARARPEYSFVLIGNVTSESAAELGRLPNVTLTGEKPYALMPAYLAELDVCLIPFRITPLTEATDPVKVYEYLSQGKPVVATTLPELRRHEGLLTLAGDADSFAAAVDAAVMEVNSERRRERIEVARANSWRERGDILERVCRDAAPLVSIIIVTFNNVEFTRLCLESVFENTHSPRFEVIVVDNASSDDTRGYLQDFQAREPRLRTVFNDTNEGFARANNRGIDCSSGETIILLNNDTVVPPGWSCRLLRHLRPADAGLVVSVTNFSGNESRIDVPYHDLGAMNAFAAKRAADHDGQSFDLPVAAMYCVAMRRAVYDLVGPLDERFTIGMFEDDDYSQRVRDAGFRVLCAEDAFVHHFGQASFKKLSQTEYFALFERNKKLFEEKWGRPWTPHQERVRRSSGPARSGVPHVSD